MKIGDLRNKTQEELKQYIVDCRKDLFNIRFQKASGQLENVNKISLLKKSIARSKTILTEQKGN